MVVYQILQNFRFINLTIICCVNTGSETVRKGIGTNDNSFVWDEAEFSWEDNFTYAPYTRVKVGVAVPKNQVRGCTLECHNERRFIQRCFSYTELCFDILIGTLQQCKCTYPQYGLGKLVAVRFYDAVNESSKRLVPSVTHADISL